MMKALVLFAVVSAASAAPLACGYVQDAQACANTRIAMGNAIKTPKVDPNGGPDITCEMGCANSQQFSPVSSTNREVECKYDCAAARAGTMSASDILVNTQIANNGISGSCRPEAAVASVALAALLLNQ